MNLEETIKRMELLSKYDTKKALNEWGEPDCKGWLNIGVVPDSNPFFGRREKDGNDMYIMVNPNAEQIDDMSTFRYRNVTYNTKPDGTGLSNYLPVNDLRRVKIYPEYRDTYYGDLFLGKRKGEQGEIMHKEFMSNLNISGDKVILKHDSSVRITDGVIKKGKTNGYSNNSDIGIYFWGSKK